MLNWVVFFMVIVISPPQSTIAQVAAVEPKVLPPDVSVPVPSLQKSLRCLSAVFPVRIAPVPPTTAKPCPALPAAVLWVRTLAVPDETTKPLTPAPVAVF